MKKRDCILITGGAGFIGSAVIRFIINSTEYSVINVDKLTYAGNLATLASVEGSDRYSFELADICDAEAIASLLTAYEPRLVMHLAAESHVDRSIASPVDFVQTNIVGTYTLLNESLKYWSQLGGRQKERFRFHHVSTDEVFGDLGHTGALFKEDTPYNPSSPYSASKAASDHLVRAWHRTYGLPTLITNCSNNYGPFQFPEKFIPLVIRNALAGVELPIYGDGSQVRDWLYVDDHAKALFEVAFNASVGATYNIGGNNEMRNIDVVKDICRILDELRDPRLVGLESYTNLITFVRDRAGHDVRYAIDASKILQDFGWKPAETFSSGLRKTIAWYLDNPDWCASGAGRTSRNQ